MKKVLFTSTALAAVAFGGVASAQGIDLFGSARLGLGYNIYSDGYALSEGDENYEDFVAISRVRFGVRMTGETPTGITYGATIRADNAGAGSGGTAGQSAGNVFVSGALGTLTYGDIDTAAENQIGHLVGELGLTDLAEEWEAPYLGNFGSDRPTVRYDYTIAGFGVSASTARDLDEYGVALGYEGAFGDFGYTLGAGYHDYDKEDLQQWSAGLGFEVFGFDTKVIYTKIEGGLETVGVGLGYSFGEFDVTGYYQTVLDNSDDGDTPDSYGIGASYDLGGGAALKGGIAEVYDGELIGDFGISLSF